MLYKIFEVVVELWVLRPLSVRPGQSSCRLLVLSQEDLPAQEDQVPEWCTGIPVVRWVAITMCHTAGFFALVQVVNFCFALSTFCSVLEGFSFLWPISVSCY